MKLLKQILGNTYGGPSISYEDGHFVLYQWGDAPVGMNILVKGKTWIEFIENLKQYHKEQMEKK